MDLTKTLESFMRKELNKNEHLKINIVKGLDMPAFAEENELLINKEYLYQTTLFANFYLLYQAEIARIRHQNWRIWSNSLSILFVFQVIALILALTLDTGNTTDNEILMLGGVLFEAFGLLLSFFGYFNLSLLLDRIHRVSVKILKLDDVEEARALALKNDLRFIVFEYPFEIPWRMLQFFKP